MAPAEGQQRTEGRKLRCELSNIKALMAWPVRKAAKSGLIPAYERELPLIERMSYSSRCYLRPPDGTDSAGDPTTTHRKIIHWRDRKKSSQL